MNYHVTIGERRREIDVRKDGDGWLVQVDGGPARRFDGRAIGTVDWLLGDESSRQAFGLHVGKEHVDVQVRGHAVRAHVVDASRAALDLGGAHSQGEVRTQMPGAVSRVLVAKGQTVTRGQVLIVVEAMKMENEFKAPMDGVVAEVHVRAGQTLASNTLLITLGEIV